MPTIDVKSVAKYNSEKDRYEISYIVKKNDGTIVTRTSIIQDTEIKAISDQVISELSTTLITSEFFLDNNLVKNSILDYSTAHYFVSDTLVVYVNGLNVTSDLDKIREDGFKLSEDYQDIIDEDANIIATNIKLVT